MTNCTWSGCDARRGIALFSALALLALSGLLVAGAFASALLIGRSGRLAHLDAELSMAADYVVNSALADAQRLGLAEIPFGATVVVPVSLPGPTSLRARLSATRLRFGVVWLVADVAGEGVDVARRRVNLVTRFAAPTVVPEAALLSAGGVEIGAGVRFESHAGGDQDCAVASAPDVVLAPGAPFHATADSSRPAIRFEARAGAADVSRYLADTIWSALATRPGVTVASGNLTVTGAISSRVLLVRGRLIVDGPALFSGLVITRGGIETRGSGSVLRGLVLSALGDSAAVKLTGVTLQFAPCVALRALDAAVPLRPVRERSWAELY